MVSLRVSRILHAGYIFENQCVRIAFDPVFENPFSRNCFSFPSIKFDQAKIRSEKFDAIFISHYHDDHCSLESLNLLDRRTPIYMYSVHDEFFSLIRELGFTQVFPLRLNSTIELGPFKITPYPALDRDVDSIFQIESGGVNILNVVDSWIDPETFDVLKKKNAWHLILWPFQTMREMEILSPSRYGLKSGRGTALDWPSEWIEQLKSLKPQWIVPSSCQFKFEDWSWQNQFYFPISYQYFEQLMCENLPETKVIRINPGNRFSTDGHVMTQVESIKWIHPVGDQNADYSFTLEQLIPTTAAVAQKFKSITDQQKKLIVDYCQTGLALKYKSFDHAESEYFAIPRKWKLSIFDHDGSGIYFFYKIGDGSIESIEPTAETDLEWTTEIPLSKFFSALHEGESLSSMYVRINDQRFSQSVESELKTIDFLEDPLLRCLFSANVASYQKSQLQKIKNQPV